MGDLKTSRCFFKLDCLPIDLAKNKIKNRRRGRKAPASFPNHTKPSTVAPGPTELSLALSALQREQQGTSDEAPCCCLQPLPHPVSPSPAAPGHAAHDHIYSPKRAAGNTEVLRAAVCNCYRGKPGLAEPHLSRPKPALSALQREQQGTSFEAPCCRLQLSPGQVPPCQTTFNPN